MPQLFLLATIVGQEVAIRSDHVESVVDIGAITPVARTSRAVRGLAALRSRVVTVIDRPFAATGELVAGFWLWDVRDMDEAVAWVKRCPNPMPGPSEIEIRPLYELADLL